jgi:hypothetical protein
VGVGGDEEYRAASRTGEVQACVPQAELHNRYEQNDLEKLFFKLVS